MEASPAPRNHYDRLGIKPGASVQQIRRAYRDLSKLCHPDTTELPAAIATAQFQALNEAYATLSSPEKRLAYDIEKGYSRYHVTQVPVDLDKAIDRTGTVSPRHLYLDPSDRPLSAGELFALFLLGVTFVACLVLVVVISIAQGEVTISRADVAALLHASLDYFKAVLPSPVS